MKFDKYLDIAKSLIHLNSSHKKHFSIIVQKNRIMSIGANCESKTDVIAKKYNYPYYFVHSELSAIKRFPQKLSELKYCTLINIRVNKLGIPKISKPCKYCQNLISLFELKRVYFTNNSGQFEEYIID